MGDDNEIKNQYMKLAVKEAEKALKIGEVPIGAVIVCKGKVISRGFNCRERKRNALWHAEIVAIDRACKKLKGWRLDDCEMFVTLQPCQMCMGAITNARIKKVYYGAQTTSDLNWKVDEEFFQCEKCGDIIKDFFKTWRGEVKGGRRD
ncbi:MAG: nucleoside deaminase [Christensenellaceae bacterium]|jgi:tRNA(adenine34) deaminase|nr:nucleoside deaminase [Christensenellaceae bacterium]